MEDYVEDYKYNNCFWKKSGVLYNHSKSKFKEYMSVGEMFHKIAEAINILCDTLDTIPTLYRPSKDENSTRKNGILVMIDYIKDLKNELHQYYKEIETIAISISEKKDSYDSKRQAAKMCDECNANFQSELDKLSLIKKQYFDVLNKTIEYYLIQKYTNKIKNGKIKTEIVNRKNIINAKKMEYKRQIKKVEKYRVEYMEFQGNIFASEEELERDCTDELKSYFKKFIEISQNCFNYKISQEKYDIIEKISGENDNKVFAEKNKSLMTGPKRNLYKEYAQDMNYYIEHFDIIKSKLKGKGDKESREIVNKINNDVTDFLRDIITEEPDQIHLRIEQIAKDIKDNKLSKDDYKYLEKQFRKKFEEFQKWKEEKVCDQEYRKVGKEWDDRFCYMYTFLGYFNKTRVDNKELDKTNFDYLCNAIKLILELNENEDIDYNLCDLIVILSSTFYMGEPNNKSGRIYINEVIKNTSIMQKQGFWVGLTRYELNEEIQKQNKSEATLKEEEINEEKLNNGVIAKLMSISFNIIQFVMDSNLFNRIIYDIFRYCKINEDNRGIVVEMLESQLQGENTNNLEIDKQLLLSPIKPTLSEDNIGNLISSNN